MLGASRAAHPDPGFGLSHRTFVPDSKRFFDVSYLQGQRFYALSITERAAIAKEFAAGKLRGYAHFFETRYQPGTSEFLGELNDIVESVYAAADVDQVRGYEGAAARRIRSRMNTLVEDPTFHVARRERKTPDRANSLLNFGYYLLFTRVNALVRSMGLNPYLGFLHEAQDDYEALACDIEELFRVHIDRLIVRLVNLKTIRPEHFIDNGRGMRLVPEAVRGFVEQFEGELNREVSPRLTLSDAIYAQVRNVKLYFTEGAHLAFYAWGR